MNVNTLAGRLAVEIPRSMRTLERDRRGYPIPWIVLRDAQGNPHFTINDHARVVEAQRKKLCAITGRKLTNGAWFVGGMRCFLHPRGAFVDPPMCEEAARYALKVCPYLAAPSYGRRIDDGTLQPGALTPDMAIVKDTAMSANRPAVFCLGVTEGYSLVPSGMPGQHYMRVTKWQHVEVWQNGAPYNDKAAINAMAATIMEDASR